MKTLAYMCIALLLALPVVAGCGSKEKEVEPPRLQDVLGDYSEEEQKEIIEKMERNQQADDLEVPELHEME